VEAMGIEPTNLLHAMQALYQLSYAPAAPSERSREGLEATPTRGRGHLPAGPPLAGSQPLSVAEVEPGRCD
jgi:hypothetical protein